MSLSSAAWACDSDDTQADGKKADNRPTLALTQSDSQRAVFQVKGVMCRSCEKKIEAALKKVDGVQSVSFLKAKSKDGIRMAQVTFKTGSKVDPKLLAEAVEGWTVK